MNFKKGKRVSSSIIFNVLGLSMFLIAIFSIYKSNAYISGLIEQGLDVNSEWIEVVNYYISAIVPYLFYGAVLIGLANIIQKLIQLIDTQNEVKLNREYINQNQLITRNNQMDDIESLLNDLED